MAETPEELQTPAPAPASAPNADDLFPTRRRLESFAEQYRLAVPERHRARLMGDLSGRSTGSSIEYQDRKDYVPGDDVRHIDWRAYARNDRLTIKLYREEITPRVDIIVDTSLSMTITPAKALRRLELTYFFTLLARKLHATVRLHDLSERLAPLGDPLDLVAAPGRRQDSPMELLAASPMTRTGGVKIFISDFLFPFSPLDLTRLFVGADRLALVQVVSQFEDDPPQGAEVRLEDAENGQHLDIALNRATIEGYKKRLGNLRAELDRRLRAMNGAFAVTRDEDALEEMTRRLLQAGVVEV